MFKTLKMYATKFLSGLSTVIEYFLAVMLAIATVALCVYLVQAFLQTDGLTGWRDFYEDALGTCLTLIIGVELVQMMFDHSPKMIFEVVLFCMARMVVSSDSVYEALVGVIAIAVLFLTKRYFFDRTDKFETDAEEIAEVESMEEAEPSKMATKEASALETVEEVEKLAAEHNLKRPED